MTKTKLMDAVKWSKDYLAKPEHHCPEWQTLIDAMEGARYEEHLYRDGLLSWGPSALIVLLEKEG